MLVQHTTERAKHCVCWVKISFAYACTCYLQPLMMDAASTAGTHLRLAATETRSSAIAQPPLYGCAILQALHINPSAVHPCQSGSSVLLPHRQLGHSGAAYLCLEELPLLQQGWKVPARWQPDYTCVVRTWRHANLISDGTTAQPQSH